MRVEVDPAIFLTYRAKDIQTRFSEFPVCIEIDSNPKDALEILKNDSFDQAPVLERSTVVGWLLTKDLESAKDVASITKYLKQTDLISTDAALNDLLQKLVSQELIFLVGSDGIEGFAVRSDIERHVSRAHLYLLISGLEIAMTKIIKRELSDFSELVANMNSDSKKAWEKAKQQNSDANVIEYMGIRDLGLGIAKIQKVLNHLGVRLEDWNNYVHQMVSIRNWVAHSNTQEMQRHPFHDVVDKMNRTEGFIRKLIRY